MAKPVYYSEGQLVDENGVPFTFTDVGNGGQRITGANLAAGAASFDFQNIPQTYKHLEILGSIRTNAAAASDAVNVSFNNDTTDANYRHQYMRGWGNTSASNESIGAAGARQVVHVTGDSATASLFSPFRIRIYNYATAQLKVAQVDSEMFAGFASLGMICRHFMYLWNNTAAINRLTLAPFTGTQLMTGSYAEIWGYRSGF